MTEKDAGNFFGSGEPTRKLKIGRVNERFPLNGDSWYDTDNNKIYIYKNSRWNLISNTFDFNSPKKIYEEKQNAIVALISYSEIDDLEANDYKSGSGFFISDDGFIVTCSHLIDSFNSAFFMILGSVYVRVFPENKIFEAEVVGRDIRTDVALLKIDLNGLPKRDFFNFKNSRNVPIGTPILILENPFPQNIQLRVNQTFKRAIQFNSFGIVRDNKKKDQSILIESVSTDNETLVFSEGGPLIDLDGNVIGISAFSISVFVDASNLFKITNSICSYLVEPIINYFKTNYLFNKSTDQIFPRGFFGISYSIYDVQKNITDRGTVTLSNKPDKIEGIIIDQSPVTVKDINDDVVSVSSVFENTPAKELGLEDNDIIIKVKRGNGTFNSIGIANNQISFESEIILALANNQLISIQYLKSSENYSTVHTANNLSMTDFPNDYNIRFHKLT